MPFRRRAKRVKHGGAARAVARFGLGSRAIIYLALAILMVDLATTGRAREADQGGALRDLGATTVGTAVLVVFAFGAVSYSLWRWSEAALGRHMLQVSRGDRLKAFVEGLCYLPFAVMAVAVVIGDSKPADQAGNYRSVSAEVMQNVPGRFLVGAVGVVVVIVGFVLFSEGPRRSFADELELERSTLAWRLTVLAGVVGATTRGTVFALSGVLVVVAAATASPAKAGGIDSALRAVAHAPFGRALLILGAIGIAAFGGFALAEARWRKVV
ncbi:MAG TPA: DUF1206 domain-containing protein [Jatrophihabitans sp.]|jgi:hypothetical protein